MRLPMWLLTFVLAVGPGCAAGSRVSLDAHSSRFSLSGERAARRYDGVAGAHGRGLDVSAEQRQALRLLAGSSARSIVQIRTVWHSPPAIDVIGTGAHATSKHSGGTGVIISSNGLILTNEHVIRRAERITVILGDGSVHDVTAVAIDPHLDLAVVLIATSGLQSITPFGRSLRWGEPVVAVARLGEDQEYSLRSGMVTDAYASLQNELDPSGRRDYATLVASTANLESGFSGGALLDGDGRFVGLSVAVSGGPTSPNRRAYAIPFGDAVSDAIARLTQEVLAATP